MYEQENFQFVDISHSAYCTIQHTYLAKIIMKILFWGGGGVLCFSVVEFQVDKQTPTFCVSVCQLISLFSTLDFCFDFLFFLKISKTTSVISLSYPFPNPQILIPTRKSLSQSQRDPYLPFPSLLSSSIINILFYSFFFGFLGGDSFPSQ